MAGGERSAGVVLIRDQESQCRCLLLRAYRYWDFPKGKIEPDETPLEAAIREVGEETGIQRLTFPWGHGYQDTEPYSRGKIARYFVARPLETRVHLGASPELGQPEHHEYRWTTWSEARSLLNDRVGRILEWAWDTSGCPRD